MRVPFSFSFSYYILKTKLELPFSLFVFPLLRATELRFSLCFSSSVSVGHQKTEFGLRFSFLVFLFYFVISRQQPVKLTRALWVCVYFFLPDDPQTGRNSLLYVSDCTYGVVITTNDKKNWAAIFKESSVIITNFSARYKTYRADCQDIDISKKIELCAFILLQIRELNGQLAPVLK